MPEKLQPPVFEHLRDELIHQGFVVGFHNSVFRAPDGEEIHRDVVKHPGAVSAVALEGDGVWLVYQFRASVKGYLWEIPAGKIDKPGEDIAETVVRELGEEIGRRPGSLEVLSGIHHSPGFCDEFQTIFLAQDLTPVPQRLEGPEENAMKVELVPFETALTMASDGTITDAKTIVGLFAAARRLEAK